MLQRTKLGAILVSKDIITQQQLDQALSEQERTGQHLGDILLTYGTLTEDQLGEALQQQTGVPYVNLSRVTIPPQIARMLPEDVVRQFACIPVKLEDEWLYVAMSPPFKLRKMEELRLLTGMRLRPLIATRREILRAINEHFSIGETTRQAIVDMRLDEFASPESATGRTALKQDPVVAFVDSLIQGAVNAQASDIHLEPQHPEMRVRYRVDGILHDVAVVPRHAQSAVVSRIKVMGDMDIAERRHPQDGHISVQIQGRELDIRVSTILTVDGEKIVLRLLDQEAMQIGLGRLGFSTEDEMLLRGWLEHPQGLVLVTGPTGSGKTTTLYSMMRELDPIHRNIMTVENPVEYRLKNVNQIQINAQIEMTFAVALRTLLRQDPDIIMVGEVRDPETAEIAVRAAMTGHMVLSTLHTNDALSAIARMTDMDVPEYLLAGSLTGVIAQRLLRSICDDCRVEDRPSLEECELLGISADHLLMHGKGCRHCFDTGYRGRVGVFELIPFDEDLRHTVTEHTSPAKLREVIRERGVHTLWEDTRGKILQGLTTLEEARRVVGIGAV